MEISQRKTRWKSIEKGRFLVGWHTLQVESSYLTTYHLKASKGIPLVARKAKIWEIQRQN
jgi:hypothetical protein